MENKEFTNILDFGAIADGKTDNTNAFKETIEFCSNKGGGIVFVPSGEFYTGPIALKSNITLYLSPGSVIRFSSNLDDYTPVKTRWEGTECHAIHPMIFGDNLENISIVGSGVIDGQGSAWWKLLRDFRSGKIKKLDYKIINEIAELNKDVDKSGSGGGGIETNFLRPSLIQLKNCKKVSLDGFITQNSAFWNTHILYCDNVSISNVMFKNPDNSPNTDGLDVDSSRNVRISNSTFDVGDDCLCLKSGIDADGRRVGIPCENITINNCTMIHGHGGVVVRLERLCTMA